MRNAVVKPSSRAYLNCDKKALSSRQARVVAIHLANQLRSFAYRQEAA